MDEVNRSHLSTIAFIGNYVPRRCGIATFTSDLLTAFSLESPRTECWAVVMNDIPEGYSYPEQVRFEIDYRDPSNYLLAADFLNINQVDIVCLQHEYGIFGGEYGGYIIDMIENLRMPVITTLHTVLENPREGQRIVLKELGRISGKLVVMSNKAKELLEKVYRIPAEKVAIIPHGIPDVPFVDPNYYKDQFGVEGKKVILTFGLLSPSKGIEYAIDALPEVVKKYPDVVYIILGATHPNVKKEQGETYRLSLQRRARELGMEKYIIFHNRFVDLKELCEFLGVADIYVTPYLGKEQIVSGTLSYALGAGKATISTPYWYAEEMLDKGRGRIVPFRDSRALASELINLFDDEVERHAMRKRAYSFCRSMIWKEVARQYLQVFCEVKADRARCPLTVFHTKTLGAMPMEIPEIKLDHMIRLTDNVGIMQHATFMIPNRLHGYTTDDNARALIAAIMAESYVTNVSQVRNLATIYLSYLYHAFDEGSRRFKNFMSYDRRWREEIGSEDCHGRAVWALGVAIRLSAFESFYSAALNLFNKALPTLLMLKSPRAWAFSIVGIQAYLGKYFGDSEARRIREALAGKLFDLYKENANSQWPWIEDVLTYANAKISHALIISGKNLNRNDMLEAGLDSLEWLMKVQTDPRGHFVPVGNCGWYKTNGDRARFDQQPIEAFETLEACIEAFKATRDERWRTRAWQCYEWFLGRNDLSMPLYDYRTSGCYDGLTADGPNRNLGAESTLSWLISLLHIRALTSAAHLDMESMEVLVETGITN